MYHSVYIHKDASTAQPPALRRPIAIAPYPRRDRPTPPDLLHSLSPIFPRPSTLSSRSLFSSSVKVDQSTNFVSATRVGDVERRYRQPRYRFRVHLSHEPGPEPFEPLDRAGGRALESDQIPRFHRPPFTDAMLVAEPGDNSHRVVPASVPAPRRTDCYMFQLFARR